MPQVSNISKLPQQLLAQVLSHVATAERIRSCSLVSVAWRNAAALATSAITIQKQTYGLSDKCNSLSRWLRQHAGTAPIDSITIGAPEWNQVELQLPVEQLKLLRKLDLARVAVASWSNDASRPKRASTPVLPSSLSALTHLAMYACEVQLAPNLALFTKLQRLALRLVMGSDSTSTTCAALALVLPLMQHLTHLELDWHAHDSVVARVRQLPKLQALLLCGGNCTAASFQVLPATLTQLQVSGPDLQLSPSSSPGLTQLTAMQWLQVKAVQFDLAVLSSMQRLQHLALDVERLQLPADQPRLAALASLTALQHLALCVNDALGLSTREDINAMTASSHLTHLEISGGVVAGRQYNRLFDAGRQLPHLRSLHASMGLVSTPFDIGALVDCCANLEALKLTPAAADDLDWLEHWGDYPFLYPVILLDGLTGLRHLTLHNMVQVCAMSTGGGAWLT